MTQEVKKDSTHYVPPLTGGISFTQEEKDRLSMLCRKEISEVERTRYNHEIMITVNKQKPKLADDNKQLQRDQLIDQHVRVVEMFTQHIESLENIQKKLE